MVSNLIETFSVDTMEEFMEVITTVSGIFKRKHMLPKFSPLWYRGQEYNHYNLQPSIFRNNLAPMKNEERYSKEHLSEDYRYQLFKSRAFDHLNVNIESQIEWQEVMQHHFTKTRLMDWSEKIISPLIFALQPFIDPHNDLNCNYARNKVTPVIWVTCPYAVNRKVYQTLTSQSKIGRRTEYFYIKRALSDLFEDNQQSKLNSLANKIGNELQKHPERYFSEFEQDKDKSSIVSGIVGLSVIEGSKYRNSSRLLRMLNNFEFNPFFYLLSRYYVDGLGAPFDINNQLPPLATIHPYHSNRIKAQAGAFTVSPYYYINNNFMKQDEYDHYKAINIDFRSMEMQTNVSDMLVKIRLTNPSYMAYQLLISGNRRSNVYPELQTYSDDIEANGYYV